MADVPPYAEYNTGPPPPPRSSHVGSSSARLDPPAMSHVGLNPTNGHASVVNDYFGDDHHGSSDARQQRPGKRKWPMDEQERPRPPPTVSAGEASYHSRNQNVPDWMQHSRGLPPPPPPNHLTQPSTAHAIQQIYEPSARPQHPPAATITSAPVYMDLQDGFVPTWKMMLPPQLAPVNPHAHQRKKSYQLSLLNVSEFTITGLPLGEAQEPTSLAGLRVPIRQISRDHGRAVYERDPEAFEGGKWRIPLGAYQAFYSYLVSQPNTTVEGIPTMQLKIASLGKARLEKDYPSSERLIQLGVPERLANTLAPFQRGGVDFVHDKKGRALIADEMGLGKSIQAIASMTIYHKEWPLLVLSPSGARYHWQNEFLNWCGEQHHKTKVDFGGAGSRDAPSGPLTGIYAEPMAPLKPSEVHVLTSAKDAVIPNRSTKVVICSYGLAPKMAEDGPLKPGLFRCAIVDESHMLKNKSSKRTANLVPVLRATSRCVLLSGTPAFARPMELYPQLSILGTESDKWWLNEHDFIKKYTKGGNVQRRAELHTLLTGTIMIRRMKNDILKQLPSKRREQALVNVCDAKTKKIFQECIALLRQGKGALAKFARVHTAEDDKDDDEPAFAANQAVGPNQTPEALEAQVQDEVQQRFEHRMNQIQYALRARQPDLDPMRMQDLILQMQNQVREELNVFRIERIKQLKRERAKSNGFHGNGESKDEEDGPRDRKSLLTYMYKKTGEAKIPLVLEMLKLWLQNPANGKVCIFSHHISVLDTLASSPSFTNGEAEFIRIDGSTSPKARQEQINNFQNDPKVRVALLGITAAGVAVTLTASSTVWFTELFWTPALLIQAEDRCHRIGQQARVRCLYLVAKGTLDEILWKHVEKKFRDLGEFVEGKEKMKIVVHETYRGVRALKESFSSVKPDLDTEPEHGMEDEGGEMATFETELYADLEEMEREEQERIKAAMNEDDDGEIEGTVQKQDTKVPPSHQPATNQPAGTTESEAICLSDDDDEEEPEDTKPKAPRKPRPLTIEGIQMERKFPRMRLYKMTFSGTSYGLEIDLFKGRVFVKGLPKDSVSNTQTTSKPDIGDIMLAINGQMIPFSVQFKSLKDFLAAALAKGSVEIIFAEEEELSTLIKNILNSGSVAKASSGPMVSEILPMLKDHTFLYDGSYEIVLDVFQGFPIVANDASAHTEGAPTIGDIIRKVDGESLAPHLRASKLNKILAKASTTTPMQITVRQANLEISQFFTNLVERRKAAAEKQKENAEVIDLLDD